MGFFIRLGSGCPGDGRVTIELTQEYADKRRGQERKIIVGKKIIFHNLKNLQL